MLNKYSKTLIPFSELKDYEDNLQHSFEFQEATSISKIKHKTSERSIIDIVAIQILDYQLTSVKVLYYLNIPDHQQYLLDEIVKYTNLKYVGKELLSQEEPDLKIYSLKVYTLKDITDFTEILEDIFLHRKTTKEALNIETNTTSADFEKIAHEDEMGKTFWGISTLYFPVVDFDKLTVNFRQGKYIDLYGYSGDIVPKKFAKRNTDDIIDFYKKYKRYAELPEATRQKFKTVVHS